MKSENTFTMTNKKTVPDTEVGQYYRYSRGEIYEVRYFNEQIILLYDGQGHRLEDREYFEDSKISGMFELDADIEISECEKEIPFEEIDWVGESAIESFERANLLTPRDFDFMQDENILDLKSVGDKALENVYEWIEENTD